MTSLATVYPFWKPGPNATRPELPENLSGHAPSPVHGLKPDSVVTAYCGAKYWGSAPLGMLAPLVRASCRWPRSTQ